MLLWIVSHGKCIREYKCSTSLRACKELLERKCVMNAALCIPQLLNVSSVNRTWQRGARQPDTELSQAVWENLITSNVWKNHGFGMLSYMAGCSDGRWSTSQKHPNGSTILTPHSHGYWLCNEQFCSDRGIKPLIFIVWASQKGGCCSGQPFPDTCQSGHKPTVNPPNVELRWISVFPDWAQPSSVGGEMKDCVDGQEVTLRKRSWDAGAYRTVWRNKSYWGCESSGSKCS